MDEAEEFLRDKFKSGTISVDLGGGWGDHNVFAIAFEKCNWKISGSGGQGLFINNHNLQLNWADVTSIESNGRYLAVKGPVHLDVQFSIKPEKSWTSIMKGLDITAVDEVSAKAVNKAMKIIHNSCHKRSKFE